MIHRDRLCYPWISPGMKYEQSIAGLDSEIYHFFEYLQPTNCEKSSRILLVDCLYNLIKSHFSNIFIDTFGSFKTDLFLPTSDIDIVIFSDWKKPPLAIFKKILMKSGYCVNESILILDRAAVPIIKFRSRKYNLKVDITFNTKDAARASNYIRLSVQNPSPVRTLVVILKQFLLQRDANEVYHGGISSYALLLMVIAFIKVIHLFHFKFCN